MTTNIVRMARSLFLKKNAVPTIKAMMNIYEPGYVEGEKKLKFESLRKPIGAQGDIIETIVRYFAGYSRKTGKYSFKLARKLMQKAFILVSTMGTGKLTMGLCVFLGLAELKLKPNGVYNVAYACPTTNLKKVRREIQATVPGARVFLLNDDSEKSIDIIRKHGSRTKKGVTFWVIGVSRARMHYKSEVWVDYSKSHQALFDARYERDKKWIKDVVHKEAYARCPKCGQVITVMKWSSKENKKVETPLTVSEVSGRIKYCNAPKFPNAAKDSPYADKKCGFRLKGIQTVSTKVVKSTGEKITYPHPRRRSYSVCRYFKKQMKGFLDFVIIDEVQDARNDRIQGTALGWLAQAAPMKLAMTGTLMNGYASSIFKLCWRLNPSCMVQEGFSYNDDARFARTYGTSEISEKKTLDGKEIRRVTAKPGISTKLYSDILCHWSLFRDMFEVFNKKDLPTYSEHLLPAPMHPDVRANLGAARDEVKREIEKARAKGFTRFRGLWDRLAICNLTYPDRLRSDLIKVTLEKVDEETGKVVDTHDVEVNIPDLHIPVTPKGDRFNELILAEKAEGRKVLLYYQYTQAHDAMQRAYQELSSVGLSCAILRADKSVEEKVNPNLVSSIIVKPEEREEWIEKNSWKYDVILCNPELVKTGLDLYDFPTIIFAQPVYNIDTMRQAARRSMRLFQKKAIKIYFSYYANSAQESAMVKVATKNETVLVSEGNVSDTELHSLSDDYEGSIVRAIAQELSSNEEVQAIESMRTPPRIVMTEEEEYNNQSIASFLGDENAYEPEAAPVELQPQPAPKQFGVLDFTQEVPKTEKAFRPSDLVLAMRTEGRGKTKRTIVEEVAADDVQAGTQFGLSFG